MCRLALTGGRGVGSSNLLAPTEKPAEVSAGFAFLSLAASPSTGVIGKHARASSLLAVLLVMVAAIVGLFMFGFEPATIYAMPVDQLMEGRRKHKRPLFQGGHGGPRG